MSNVWTKIPNSGQIVMCTFPNQLSQCQDNFQMLLRALHVHTHTNTRKFTALHTHTYIACKHSDTYMYMYMYVCMTYVPTYVCTYICLRAYDNSRTQDKIRSTSDQNHPLPVKMLVVTCVVLLKCPNTFQWLS